MTDVLQEFCGCAVYRPGYETGMVVCWACEQIVGRTDEYGAGTVAQLHADLDVARVAARRLTPKDMYYAIRREDRPATSPVKEEAPRA